MHRSMHVLKDLKYNELEIASKLMQGLKPHQDI
jgi:hypothetical protein